MEYIYTALLLHKAGKEITEDNISKVLTAAGVKADDAKVKTMVAALKEVNIDEAISKSMSVPAAPAPVAAATENKEEETSEEEKKISEEEAVSGLSALFG